MISCLVKNSFLSTSVCKYAVLIKVFDLENPSLHNVNVSPTYMNSVSSIVFIFFFFQALISHLDPKLVQFSKCQHSEKKSLSLYCWVKKDLEIQSSWPWRQRPRPMHACSIPKTVRPEGTISLTVCPNSEFKISSCELVFDSSLYSFKLAKLLLWTTSDPSPLSIGSLLIITSDSAWVSDELNSCICAGGGGGKGGGGGGAKNLSGATPGGGGGGPGPSWLFIAEAIQFQSLVNSVQWNGVEAMVFATLKHNTHTPTKANFIALFEALELKAKGSSTTSRAAKRWWPTKCGKTRA